MLYKAKTAYGDLRKDIGVAIGLEPNPDPNDPDVKQLKSMTAGVNLDSSTIKFCCLHVCCCSNAHSVLFQELQQYKEQGSF